jgi:hypothetical protein
MALWCVAEMPRAEMWALIQSAYQLREVVAELEESSDYWSEYFVPLGIVGRIKAALKASRGEA